MMRRTIRRFDKVRRGLEGVTQVIAGGLEIFEVGCQIEVFPAQRAANVLILLRVPELAVSVEIKGGIRLWQKKTRKASKKIPPSSDVREPGLSGRT